MNLAPQSWERIIDASWRHRVGLRFMLMLLRLDPETYTVSGYPNVSGAVTHLSFFYFYSMQTHVDLFIKVLLESMVSAKVTIENEYMALIFSIDKLRHPILRRVPCQPEPETSDYHISINDFLTLRLPAVSSEFLQGTVMHIH